MAILKIEFLRIAAEAEKVRPFGIDMSIESLSSKSFSTGMFYFLIFAIIIFVAIAFLYMFKDKTQKLKKGEKILFGWILFGVIVAIGMGAVQMMHGFLI